MERLSTDIVARGRGWHLTRVEARREPLLGALITVGPWHQTRIVESGGVIIGTTSGVSILGPGHAAELEASSRYLYVPIGTRHPAVEWVLSVGEGADDDQPDVARRPPSREPIAVPFARAGAADAFDYPDWALPWLALPFDVATWASCLDVRATSLSQRTKRLVGESPKRLLAAMRATVAFELAAHYRGRGTDLALDTGYSSHAHLSSDISQRFGVPLTSLLTDNIIAELDWLRLIKGALR